MLLGRVRNMAIEHGVQVDFYQKRVILRLVIVDSNQSMCLNSTHLLPMNHTLDAIKHADRNKLALLASVLPGLGHILKGYRGLGLAILILGNLLVIFTAVWLSLATVGLSIIILPALWFVLIAASAFFVKDRLTSTPPPITFKNWG